ncbi:MAG TPA: cysteine--tRNA ligase, partial [Candidatus Paceibacterota bacterium]|nr:cysteine--tRNA ligase [Candidatus Paceibacterota bacterium]
MISLTNTLTRRKEEFEPIAPGRVGIYSCGPTVYHYVHIGNLRSFLLSDLARRIFEYDGYEVRQVINITDVGHLAGDSDEGEDKIEREAKKTGRTAEEIAAFYTEAFFADLKALNIKTESTVFPKASEHIAEQLEIIKVLEAKGHTYRTSDGIYFDTSRFDAYGELARLDTEGLKAGARIEVNPEKRNPADFALWKFSPAGGKRQQEWESPWGIGFPGWHIECSAMSMKYLGKHFDIHTGGIDLAFPHHSNERAQSECATGQTFANVWLHGEFVNIASEKMSKSLGNVYRLADLEEKGFSPLAYRYWLLTAHYRSLVNFTWEALAGAQTAL